MRDLTSKPTLVANFADQWGPVLSHKMDLVKEQSEAGVYTVKRTAHYLKRVATHTKNAGVVCLSLW
jgi:hypothetical protein